MSIKHLTNQKDGLEIDLYCKNLTSNGIDLNRTSWTVKVGDTLSDGIANLSGLEILTPSPTDDYPYGRCGTVEFKAYRKDMIDDDGENTYYVRRKGQITVTALNGTADRTWTFPNLTFDNVVGTGGYRIIHNHIVAYEPTGSMQATNGCQISKSYLGTVSVVNDNFITCGFKDINMPLAKVWQIHYDIAVGKTGKLVE